MIAGSTITIPLFPVYSTNKSVDNTIDTNTSSPYYGSASPKWSVFNFNSSASDFKIRVVIEGVYQWVPDPVNWRI